MQVIWHAKYVAQTKAERERINLLMRLACPCCIASVYTGNEQRECHHITEGNKRLGHWYTIGLCRGHHVGTFSERQRLMIDDKHLVSVTYHKRSFVAVFGTEREIWEQQQAKLGLSAEWPTSKILPRRI